MLAFLALTIAANNAMRKQQTLSVTRQDHLAHPQPQRNDKTLKYWLGRLIVFALGMATIVQTIIAVWGPPWPTLPDVAVGPPGSSDKTNPFEIPFEVTNRSIFFPINDAEFSCDIEVVHMHNSHMQSDLYVDGGHFITQSITFQKNASFKCLFPITWDGKFINVSMHISVNMKLWPWIKQQHYDLGAFSWDGNSDPPRWMVGEEVGGNPWFWKKNSSSPYPPNLPIDPNCPPPKLCR